MIDPNTKIVSWSHSRLIDWDKCKFRAWLKHVQRIPEPVRALSKGKDEHANDRGTRIHSNIEQYISGQINELLPEVEKHFGPHIDFLRILYEEGIVSLEGEWGFDEEWNPTEYQTAWHRTKLDAIVFWNKQTATVIDYKSGRKFGNEVKHGEQLQLYQLDTFMRYPQLEFVDTELWYIDQNEITRREFTREQGLRFKSGFDARGKTITNATEFPANPNRFSCQYCMYGPWGSGHCQKGVK